MYENVQGRRSYLRNVQAMSLATGLLYTGLMWAACTALWTALKVFGILYLVFGLPSRYFVFGLPALKVELSPEICFFCCCSTMKFPPFSL